MIRFHKRHRTEYWSLSKLAKYIRSKAGLTNPYALSAEGWNEHKKQSKETAPFIDWITHSPLNKLQDIVMFLPDCLYSVKVFYRNYKDKSHVLEGGFEVGQWVDRCTRINTCLFYELEKFIEKEKGLDTLAWEKTLVWNEDCGYDSTHSEYGKPTGQALAAIEQETIYNWWKVNKERDFSEEAGLSKYWADTLKDDRGIWEMISDKSPELSTCYKLQDELETNFKKEEEDMLIRLIRIRDHLWT